MLLAWMIFFLLAVFPEAGMVLFMGVYYWVSQYVRVEALIVILLASSHKLRVRISSEK